MNKKKRSTSLTRNFLKCFSYRGAKQDPICPISVKHRTCSLDAIGDDTTRPPTTNEKDGIDYHFVESKASMEENIRNKRFIEVDKFQDHYYALSLDSVWNTLRLGKSCILELDLDAVKLLEEAGLFPLSILLKPRSINCLRLMQHWLTEDQTRRSYESTLHIEDENWQFLSAIIPFNDLDEAVKLVQNFIQLHSGPLIWVPCRSSILQSDKFLIRSPDSSFCQSQEQSQLKGVGGVNDPPHPQTPNYRLADVSI